MERIERKIRDFKEFNEHYAGWNRRYIGLPGEEYSRALETIAGKGKEELVEILSDCSDIERE